MKRWLGSDPVACAGSAANPQDTEKVYDLIILGGGCAGLSLAMRLAAQGDRCPRTLVLEARSAYADDRTWCFWDDGSMWLHHLVRHSWRSMTITTPDQATTADCGAMAYRMLPSGAFYAEALARIALNDRIDIILGSPVTAKPEKVHDAWRISTDDCVGTARWVIDTRPSRRPRTGDATLWQSFSGHEVVCERAIFDPERTDLMDFSESRRGRIAFTYILPTSTTSALIETTIFDPEPFDQVAMAPGLASATERCLGNAAYTVNRTEHGVLPMGGQPVPINADRSFITVGLHAGAARPSSGYAFRRIQTWAEECASELLAGGAPQGHRRDPLLLQAMDGLFLSVLDANRELAPWLFHALFAKADTQRVIRFMSDQGTIADYIAMAATLPTGLFLRQIPAALANHIGRRQEAAS